MNVFSMHSGRPVIVPIGSIAAMLAVLSFAIAWPWTTHATEKVEPAGLAGYPAAKVRPLGLIGSSDSVAEALVAAWLQTRAAAPDTAALAMRVIGQPDSRGLGFSGRSEPEDLLSMHLGFLIPSTITIATLGKEADRDKGLATIRRALGMVSLDPEIENAIGTFVEAIGSGTIGPASVLASAIFKAGFTTMLKADDRLHGYFLIGMWAGFCSLTTLGQSTDFSHSLADLGEQFSDMLRRDAIFGGSDRLLAGKVSRLAIGLRKADPDAELSQLLVGQILQVTPDTLEAE